MDVEEREEEEDPNGALAFAVCLIQYSLFTLCKMLFDSKVKCLQVNTTLHACACICICVVHCVTCINLCM